MSKLIMIFVLLMSVDIQTVSDNHFCKMDGELKKVLQFNGKYPFNDPMHEIRSWRHYHMDA